jgi:hypothetical protein
VQRDKYRQRVKAMQRDKYRQRDEKRQTDKERQRDRKRQMDAKRQGDMLTSWLPISRIPTLKIVQDRRLFLEHDPSFG